MKTDAIDTLVTGGTGFIGRWLLAALTARGRRVAALVRGGRGRAGELERFVESHGGDPSLLVSLDGDVERASLGLTEALTNVRDVYHLAARFSFGLDPAQARKSNVEATMNVARWARARPSLRRFVLLGGYRMTRPEPALAALREDLDEASILRLYAGRGAYEVSKHEAYWAAKRYAREASLPLTVVHPSGVIGDSRTGETTQLLGVGDAIERLFQGALPALIGDGETFVPIVTVDYLASFLASVVDRVETVGQDLVVLDPATPPMHAMIAATAAHMGVRAPTLRLPKGLVEALPAKLSGLDRESLAFLSPDRYDTASAEAHASAVGLSMPDATTSLQRWCDYLVSTRFVTQPLADRGAFRARLFVVGDEQRAPIVFLHGLPWNSDAWKPLAKRLSIPSARVDLPGLGRSSATASEGAWLSTRTEPVTLVGHSYGAAVAVRLALAHPDKVRSLVLVAPAFLQRRTSWVLRVRPLVRSSLRRLSADALRQRVGLSSGVATEALESAVTDLQRRSVAATVADALASGASSATRAALREALEGLQIPVSIVCGAEDPLVVETRHEVVAIAGAGHCPHLSHPEALAPIVERAITHETAAHRANESAFGPFANLPTPFAPMRERDLARVEEVPQNTEPT